MTEPHALYSVRLTLTAQAAAGRWPGPVQARTMAALEPVIAQGVIFAWDRAAWLTLVATFRSPDEDPTEAAQRLTKYLLAYQETHGRFPSLGAVQEHSAKRHLGESR